MWLVLLHILQAQYLPVGWKLLYPCKELQGQTSKINFLHSAFFAVLNQEYVTSFRLKDRLILIG